MVEFLAGTSGQVLPTAALVNLLGARWSAHKSADDSESKEKKEAENERIRRKAKDTLAGIQQAAAAAKIENAKKEAVGTVLYCTVLYCIVL